MKTVLATRSRSRYDENLCNRYIGFMEPELVYVSLDDHRLTLLAQASEATGRTVEELIQEAVGEFLDERRAK